MKGDTISAPRHVDGTATRSVYQVYLASFQDSNGDGIGDLPGLTSRLDYIATLGVDAIWVSPGFPSPWQDGGYDITDFYGVHPRFGTMTDLADMIDQAHCRNLEVMADLVINHTSSEHEWFKKALQSPPGSKARDFYHFADGRGPEQNQPPNDWISAFGGSAWTRTIDPDGKPGQWYLHLFSASQPDLNWTNRHVEHEIHEAIRFWLSQGVDGFRIDAASALSKEPGLPNAGFSPGDNFCPESWEDSPLWDHHKVHDVLSGLRKVCDESARHIFLLGEVTTATKKRFATYLRPGELDSAFDRKFLQATWDCREFRDAIDAHQLSYPQACWTLESHDEVRSATRLAAEPSSHSGSRAASSTKSCTRKAGDSSFDISGTPRARAAALLMLALPGLTCIYQGQELGLPQVATPALPPDNDAVLADPAHERLGCRVPIPWDGDAPPFGFTTPPATPWLPQPHNWSTLTVTHQSSQPLSTLEMFRQAALLRNDLPELRSPSFAWIEIDEPDLLAFARSDRFRCVTNFSTKAVKLDWQVRIVATSSTNANQRLAQNDEHATLVIDPDTTVWIYHHTAT